MEFNQWCRFIPLFGKTLILNILVFINSSNERDIIFNLVKDNKESDFKSVIDEIKPECMCQYQRSNENKQYNKYIISNFEKNLFKFDKFGKLNEKNTSVEIFLCHHIKEAEFSIFYDVLISYYLQDDKMTNDRFYTVLYFLEYFRIKQNNKLRNVLKTILYSLAKSDYKKHFNVDKVSFNFSKQKYFSHELFKKISQEYFKILNFKTPSKLSFFIKEKETYMPNQYKGLYTEDKKYILVINNIIFYYSPIYDEIIKYLNINSIIRSLRKIVFINSFIETNLRFSYKLNKKIEFILYENSISSERYKVAEIENVENLNIIEEILNNLQYASRKSSIKDFDSSNTNISENKIKFYSKLFEVDTPTNKIKIFELLNLQNKNLEIKCFYDNYGNFLSILITLKELYLKQFAFKNTILEKNIKEIVIQNSNINSNFLTDILSINELESLKISYNNIYIEHDIIIRNRSIKYFGFKANNCDDIPHFYKLLGFLTGLKKYHSSLATDSKWYYDEKFGCTVPLKVLKKLAQSEMGSEVKLEENGERRRIAPLLIDASILAEIA
ncbi:hypothetical protein CWI37_0345p0010 [Hamiltosporidium tvaerminnensis]|uniref:Uncharacterized protein n=1 Tax=Hamiltosporidium tvaerminnensis TaxID=1176355 RepID=A0A4Q9L8T0_9MICR|nr:hypothetical protein CWI37_0345p0010 [Hamiltosporidium tvaerminnensis]